MRLRRGGAAHVHRRRGRAAARRPRRARQHRDRGRAGRRGRADQVPRSVRRRRDRRALALQRPARARDLRRPDEARVRVPPDVAAAAPPAGPRGVPGRRLLPALAPAGAVGEAVRRPRRRLVHRAADHRDAGGRRVGVHPDERHLDHRRPDLPRGGPVPLGRAAGHQRRHLGVARGRLGADHADAEGGRQAAARALAVPRARGVRPVRLGPRRRHAGHAEPRRPAGRGAEPGGAPSAQDRGPGGVDLRRHRRLPRPHQGRARPGVPPVPARPAARRERRPDVEDRRGRVERRDRGAARRLHRRGHRRLRARLRRGGQPARGGRVRPDQVRGGAREGGPHRGGPEGVRGGRRRRRRGRRLRQTRTTTRSPKRRPRSRRRRRPRWPT